MEGNIITTGVTMLMGTYTPAKELSKLVATVITGAFIKCIPANVYKVAIKYRSYIRNNNKKSNQPL